MPNVEIEVGSFWMLNHTHEANQVTKDTIICKVLSATDTYVFLNVYDAYGTHALPPRSVLRDEFSLYYIKLDGNLYVKK